MKRGTKSFMYAIGVVLALPWVALWLIYRGTQGLITGARILPWTVRNEIRCPVGHRNVLVGRWSCRCGASWLGYAFAECPEPTCRAVGASIPCVTCGLTISNPML